VLQEQAPNQARLGVRQPLQQLSPLQQLQRWLDMQAQVGHAQAWVGVRQGGAYCEEVGSGSILLKAEH
jgi:hypothetical protein